MSQKETLNQSGLIYTDYNVCREKVIKWFKENGTQRDVDLFTLGIHFALAIACSNYIKHGIDISTIEAKSLEQCMEIIEQYKITDVFMDMDNIDYMYLREYSIWNNQIKVK